MALGIGQSQTPEPQPPRKPAGEPASSEPAPTEPVSPPPSNVIKETTKEIVKNEPPPLAREAKIEVKDSAPAEVVLTKITGAAKAEPSVPAGKRRKLTIGAMVGIYIALAVFVWILIAMISTRFLPRPWDVTQVRTFTLAPETRELIKRVGEPLHITTLFTEEGDVRKVVLSEIEDIVELLKIESTDIFGTSKIYYQRINPDRDPAATHELISRTKVDSREENYKNGIVLELGKRAALIPFNRISVVELVSVARTRMWQEKAFHGETAIASAILNLMEDQHPNVDFVLGHGEMDTEDPNLKNGLLYAKNALLEEKIRVRQLFLMEKLKIPDDSSAIVILGPTEPFNAPEIAEIQKFLERGGGVFIGVEPGRHTGLDSLLARYGIEIGRNRVVDTLQKKAGAKLATTMLVKKVGDHPITAPLSTTNLMIANASTVRKTGVTASLVPRLNRTELLWSSESAWAESDLTNQKVSFNPEVGDLKGPVPYAIAAEVPADANDPKAAARGGIRLVVVGSKEIFSNVAFVDVPANGDLFQNIINWVAKRDRMATVRPRTPDLRTLTITEERAEQLALVAYFGVPILFAIVGFFIWWRRRS